MTQEEWNNAEHFLEGYMLDLTYDIVTQKVKLTDLIDTDQEVILTYDPFAIGETDQSWLLQDLIDYYVELEEYERLSHIPQKDIDNGYDDSKRLMTLGKVNMLKWVLGIPKEEYTNIQL